MKSSKGQVEKLTYVIFIVVNIYLQSGDYN